MYNKRIDLGFYLEKGWGKVLGLMGIIECYNTYDQDDIYFNIAELILRDYRQLKVSSIQDFAESLHISVSTAQRFVKQLYFDNFTNFRAGYYNFSEHYLYDGKYIEGSEEVNISPAEYGRLVSQRINNVMGTLDEQSVESFIEQIIQSEQIVFVGIPMTSEVWRLQVELILMGKRTSAFIDPNYQRKAVEKVNEKSFVVCIQYMRQEDAHNELILKTAKEKGAKVGYISHVKKKCVEDILDIGIEYKGNNTQTDSIIMGIILNYIGTRLAKEIDR